MSAGNAHTNHGGRRAIRVNAPAIATTAKAQKHHTPRFAHVASMLTVEAVWIAQSMPSSSKPRAVVQNATCAT
jgi:hypothetical protein